jgi:DNA repair photolyase
MAKLSQPGLFGPDGSGQPNRQFSQGGVIIREVRCASLLNQSGISDYSFNCYTSCSHGCAYCYARFMQRFHPHDEAWGRFVDVKVNAAEVLSRQLRRLAPGSVFTCSACDGWQPIERRYRLTRECCRLLLEAGFRLNVLTKNKLVLRDLDVFAGKDVSVGVTITSADRAVAKLWEPGASSVSDRVEVIKQAKTAGLRTTMMFGPLLPAISDTPEALRALFELARDAAVDRIWTDALNPRPLVWPVVRELLARHRSELVEHYRRILFEEDFRDRYLAGLNQRIRQAADETGLADRLA